MLECAPTHSPIFATINRLFMLLQSLWLRVAYTTSCAEITAQALRQVSPPVSFCVGGLTDGILATWEITLFAVALRPVLLDLMFVHVVLGFELIATGTHKHLVVG